MKIAIDISPLATGHKVRGVGFYLSHLKDALVKYFPQHEYIFFTKSSEIPQDVTLVHYPYFDPFFLTLPLVKKHKTVVTVHDLTPLVFQDKFPAGFKGMVKWRVQRIALKMSDMILADSQQSKDDIVRLTGVRKSKIAVSYLAAGEEFVPLDKKILEKMHIQEKYHLPKKFALYVGDVTWNKNVPNIIKACLLGNIPLVLVGKALAQGQVVQDNPWTNPLRQVQVLLKENKDVHVVGFVSSADLVGLYNSATLFLMPSFYEGFGLPVLEAMSCGVPVVASDGGSLKEVVGEAAYMVNPQDIAAMSEGFVKVFTDEELQKSLIKKGFQQAKKFSWKQTATDAMEVYEKVSKL